MGYFDPASRKTVACKELVDAFAENPHPDGKVMTALAEQLGLNKKQVSNFFERERRKAGLVVASETKKRQVAAHASRKQGSSAGSVAASSSGSGKNRPKTGSPAPSVASTSASSTRLQVQGGTSARAPRKRTRRTALLDESDIESEEDDDEMLFDDDDDNDITQDGDGREATDVRAPEQHSAEREARETLDGSTRPATRSTMTRQISNDASRMTSLTVPSPSALPKSRATSHIPSPVRRQGRQPVVQPQSAPLLSSAAHSAQPPRKKRRSFAPKESPTVQFLKNPFPSPISELYQQVYYNALPAYHSTSHSSPGGPLPVPLPFGELYNLQPARQRKRARVWFTRRESGDAPAVTYYNNGRPMSSPSDSFGKTQHSPSRAAVIPSLPAAPGSNSTGANGFVGIAADSSGATVGATIMTRGASSAAQTALRAGAPDDAAEEDDGDDGSEYDADELLAARRRDKQRAGAALRTTIACSELRNAFLANPHPAAGVLDELAVKLGLGKKQVSNYFVRERKKAGYTIKVRHGLNRRQKKGKKSTSASSLGVAPRSAQDGDAASVMHAGTLPAVEGDVGMDDGAEEEEEVEDEEEEEEEEEEDDASSQVSEVEVALREQHDALTSMGGDKLHSGNGNTDDLPDLSYDDVASLRSEHIAHHDASLTTPAHAHSHSHSHSLTSLVMLASNSQDSITSSSPSVASTSANANTHAAASAHGPQVVTDSPPYAIRPLARPSDLKRPDEQEQTDHRGLPLLA